MIEYLRKSYTSVIFYKIIFAYSIFTWSPELSRFKSTNNKSQLYHTDIHIQVLIAFNN